MSAFASFAEEEGVGEAYQMMSEAAKEHKVVLVGGSIAERDASGKLFNTSYSFGRAGELLGKYRKNHLFDIDIPGKMTFKESDTLSPGSGLTVLRTDHGPIGLGICYDIRFPEQSLLYAHRHGCKLLCFPGAFNTTTGPKHWELLIRARAVDTQCFVVAASPARNPASTYQAWGHSSVCSPWGEIIATTGHEEDVFTADIDLAVADEIRGMIPVSHQRRADIYRLTETQNLE